MSKKLFALLALSTLAVAAVAKADTANVNVYGTINAAFENVQNTGAANPGSDYTNRFRLTSNSSNFGIKGTEDLGAGLKFIFQVENSLDLAKGTGIVANRNSQVGFTGGFGTAFYGIWDTPFKSANVFMEPFYATGVGYLASITDSFGAASSSSFSSSNTPATFTNGTVTAGDRNAFSRREGNSIQYWTPTYMGLTAKLVYSTNTDRSVTPYSTTAYPLNPALYGASLSYSDNGIDAAFAYELHKDFGTVGTGPAAASSVFSTSDTGLKAAVGYTMGDTKIGVTWTNLKQNNLTYGSDLETLNAYQTHNNFALGLQQKFDAFTARLGYAWAGKLGGKKVATDTTTGKLSEQDLDLNTTTSTGAQQLSVGGSYSFSKRTDMYLLYSKIWNQDKATYNFIISDVKKGIVGADPQSIALGIRTTF